MNNDKDNATLYAELEAVLMYLKPVKIILLPILMSGAPQESPRRSGICVIFLLKACQNGSRFFFMVKIF